MKGKIATADIDIAATPDRVWRALTDPAQIKEYMMGAEVDTDWQVGSPIAWRGEFNGKRYEDRGEVVEFSPTRRLVVTHFSPLSGDEDRPENYHHVAYELTDVADGTHVALRQDGNASDEEAEHSARTWTMMLEGLKKVVERA
jgi:uncharacterized protein YndB with AHSA1/START domain